MSVTLVAILSFIAGLIFWDTLKILCVFVRTLYRATYSALSMCCFATLKPGWTRRQALTRFHLALYHSVKDHMHWEFWRGAEIELPPFRRGR